MEFSNAALRYLVAVYELSDGGSAVRSVDIARMMEVSPASVVHMMGVLSQGGFVRKRRYGQVQLTGEGIRTANRLYTKAALLEAFFLQELGVDDQIARRLQISGHTLYMNEIALLRHAMEQGMGWGFLPEHLRPGEWQGVAEIATEVGSQGLNVTMVMLWLPGMNKHRMLSDLVDEAPELWRRR